jgi:hypothetical protein
VLNASNFGGRWTQRVTRIAFCEGVSRARLEVPLKFNRTLFILKTEMKHYLPRTIFGCMRRPACIMGSKPLIKVGGDADVVLIWDRDALEEVDVLHEPSPFARWCFGGQPSL